MRDDLLPIVQKAGQPLWAAQFCGFTFGGWWPTKAQAESFAKNALPVVEARIQIECEWAVRQAFKENGPG